MKEIFEKNVAVDGLVVSRTRLLDFIIIGAAKSGTSSLVQFLRQSPGVYMPTREIRWFRDPFYSNQGEVDALIADARDARLVGIKHPSYLGRGEVPERIWRYNPAIKLIAILRNPIDRAISSYHHYVRLGQIPPLPPSEGLMHAVANTGSSPKYRDIIEFGKYHYYLSLYRRYFPPEQILLLDYSGIGSADLEKRLLGFLGVAGDPNVHIEHANPGVYDWAQCLIAHVRSRATLRYDGAMNLIGRRMEPDQWVLDAVEQLHEVLESGPARESHLLNIRPNLVAVYRSDVVNLGASGWFDISGWREFN